MTNTQIATEILSQMETTTGKLRAMLGTQTVVAIENGVKFNFKMCGKANWVTIVLTSADLYDVTFIKANKNGMNAVKEYEGLYADSLKSVFESFTGLYLKLF